MLTKLSLQQMKEITVGALYVEEKKDGFHFYKCTKKQTDASDLGERSKTTSGVRLDFYTDSKTFAFRVQTKGRYEVYVDQVLMHAFSDQDFESEMEKSIGLSGDEHRITLYLPNHSVGVLEWVELDDGATIRPHEYDCKILFMGDSITQGWDSTWASLSYAQSVSRFFNANSLIQGIGGAIFHESTFDENIDFEPDIVIVAYGTNDWPSSPTTDEGRMNCKNFLDCVVKRYGGKKIFGISPLWRADCGEQRRMGGFEACTSYVKEEIQKHGMILIDGEELTPHWPEFYSDGFLHPNSTGFGIYTQNLIAKMLKFI